MAHLAAHITLTARDVPPLSHLHPGSIHVAIISDGNGRWATSRGLPRSSGHRAGAVAARGVIAAAPRLGVHTLSLIHISAEAVAGDHNFPAAFSITRLLGEYSRLEIP